MSLLFGLGQTLGTSPTADEPMEGRLHHATTQEASDANASLRKLQQCEADSGGNYGTLQGATSRLVLFYYQAVLLPSTTPTQLDLVIRPKVERGIVNGILPMLFDCPTAIPSTEIEGISMLPDDQFVSNLSCVRGSNANCYTFTGRMVVSSNAIPDSAAAANILLPTIQQYMESQQGSSELLALDSRIVFFDYVEIVNGVPTQPLPQPTPLVSSTPTAAPVSIICGNCKTGKSKKKKECKKKCKEDKKGKKKGGK